VTDARSLVIRLLSEAKLTPTEISEALGGRVSSRTVYRWAKGESSPQNTSDYEALDALVTARLPRRGRKPKEATPDGTPEVATEADETA
jgi:hypothetical protein